jgi:hypothetical protein
MYGRRWLLTVARIATIAAALGGFASSNALAQSQSQPVAAARAEMFVVDADPQKFPMSSLGTVVWSVIPPAAGQPESFRVRAEADIPYRKMRAVMTISKNTDPTLSASHTIELRVTFSDGTEIKGVKEMQMPMMRSENPPAQDSLAGASVKISDGYFLVGLNRADADVARNLDLIGSRGWFDFPLLLNDDRTAKLSFQKGPDGDRILTAALAAWTAQPQVPEPQPTPAAQAAPPFADCAFAEASSISYADHGHLLGRRGLLNCDGPNPASGLLRQGVCIPCSTLDCPSNPSPFQCTSHA